MIMMPIGRMFTPSSLSDKITLGRPTLRITSCSSYAHVVLQMLMKLHDDDDYQKDVGDPKALDAIILLLQKHPDRFER